jgi:hypothetical protein
MMGTIGVSNASDWAIWLKYFHWLMAISVEMEGINTERESHKTILTLYTVCTL